MKKSVTVLWACMLCVTASLSLFAQETNAAREALAEIEIASDGIALHTTGTFQRLYLTISGPGDFIMQKEFGGKDTPFIDLRDDYGQWLADGQYAFELKAKPFISKDAQLAMDWARQTGDYSPVEELRKNGQIPAAESLVQSGYFRISQGEFVVPSQAMEAATIAGAQQTANKEGQNGRNGEDPIGNGVGGNGGTEFPGDSRSYDSDVERRDQVIADDLIVQFSACIGNDCVNGETFGFDTIRLKENNTRIKFEDTSTGSFPSTDWQLTANDSASGGANRFSIDDVTGGRTPFTVEGSAPSHSLYVDDGGRLGLGTSTPVVDVHVVSGNTPTLRLQQDGSSGFAAQTWDVAGNETNFFIRDASNGSTLPFRIRPSAPSSSIYIDTDGDVGMGTASPEASLEVTATDGTSMILVDENSGTNAVRDMLYLQNTGGVSFVLEDTVTTNVWRMSNNAGLRWSVAGTSISEFILGVDGRVRMGNNGANGNSFDLAANSGNLVISGMLTEGSDRNIKRNITDVDEHEVLDRLSQLPISHWTYNAEPENVRHMGPMAQDFRALFGLGDRDTGIGNLDASGVALASIKALNEKLQEKECQIDELKTANQDLSEKLNQLELMIDQVNRKLTEEK